MLQMENIEKAKRLSRKLQDCRNLRIRLDTATDLRVEIAPGRYAVTPVDDADYWLPIDSTIALAIRALVEAYLTSRETELIERLRAIGVEPIADTHFEEVPDG